MTGSTKMSRSPKIFKGAKSAVGGALRAVSAVVLLAAFIFAFNMSMSSEAEAHSSITVTSSGFGTTAAGGGLSAGPNSSDTKSTFHAGDQATITATPSAEYTFTGWTVAGSAACAGVGNCVVTMGAVNITVTATYVSNNNTLTVTKTATGGSAGTVTSAPAGISCDPTCSASFVRTATVVLTATATSGTFGGWSGAGCSGTGTCTVTMDAARSVTATFGNPTLSVVVTNGAQGSVTSAPAGIAACVGSCSTTAIAQGASVVLTASPSAGYRPSWSGGTCSGTALTCSFTLNSSTTVNVNFLKPVLTVVNGAHGSVSGGGIACTSGLTCTASIDYGTSVTLTAAPQDASYSISSWSGAGCSGNGTTCTFTITGDTTVTVSFSAGNQLTVTKAGTGAGTVTSNPAGIDCGATCNALFTSGQSVTLTAAAAAGSVFYAWSGDCSGSALTCTVTMSAAKDVTATFNLPTQYTMDQNDCIKPPFLGQSPLPNLLLMFDNSLSMYDQQYFSSVDSGVDSSYDNTKTYTGYFITTKYYQGLNPTDLAGDGANSYFSVYTGVFASDYPSSGVYPNASCDYYTPYLCVKINSATSPHTLSNFVASGNFLNWLTASKMDIQKQILTGGKYDYDVTRPATSRYRLIAETRGWNGMRYIRQVQNPNAGAGTYGSTTLPWYSFSVRGPLSTSSTVSPGGNTRIEISEGYYNYALCQAAVADWVEGKSMGTAKQDIDACLTPAGGTSGAVQSAKNAVFNESTQACWEVSQGRAIPAGKYNNMPGFCQDAYAAGVDAALIKPTDLSYICSSAGAAQTTPNVMAGSFLGWCWTAAGVVAYGAVPAHGNACTDRELEDYCAMFIAPPVTDPTGYSGYVSGATSTWGIPAQFTDAGLLAQTGDPIGVLRVNVAFAADSTCVSYTNPSAPCGLVHQFDKYIRFGVMAFNDYGAKSECAADARLSTTCATEKDGGYIAKYIKSPSSAGSAANYDCTDGAFYIYDPLLADNTGLSTAINAIQARTWTPWAEAYYNALAYYTSGVNTSATPPTKLNAADFYYPPTKDPLTDAALTACVTNPNPIGSGGATYSAGRSQVTCRQNNILIISDGMSTADLNANVSTLATTYNDGDGNINAAAVACLDYSGSKNLDDLSWLAYNKDIFTFAAKSSTTTASNYITTYAVYTGTSTGSTDECTAEGLMRATATNGGTSLYAASDPASLKTALTTAFLSISKRAAAGTAASVLGERGQLGMNVMQAVFYPSKLFPTGESLTWIGYLNNIWYYTNKTTLQSNLREDTVEDDVLNLQNDYVMEFAFINLELKILRWQDTTGDGSPDTAISPNITLDDFKPVWEAGKLLRDRATERTIYVNDDSNSYPKLAGRSLTAFTDANKASFKAFLGDLNGDAIVSNDDAEATKLINYVRGVDQSGYRTRTVDGSVWKLGDIVYSTPDVVGYDDYSVVYVGANDGMLHAFKVGKLTSAGLTAPDTTKLVNTIGTDDGIPVGEEMWAFIPKNALPYLRYLGDPNYCHVYMVDLRPYVTTLAYKGKKLLIGGMRMGGQCGGASTLKPKTDVCPAASLGSLGVDGVNTSSGNDCVGLSSYFAMDVTDPTAPKLLWEFSHPNLKFSYSGPAIITRANTTYVMFLSGPDAYDGTVTAGQNINAFILKLDKDALTISSITRQDGGASFARSFGGRLFTEGLDINEDGQTDFVFYGYSKYGGTSGGEDVWDGGIVKLWTGDVDPALWDYDTNYVTFDLDGNGTPEGYPFAGKVTYSKCFSDSRYHLNFGSGLYFKTNQTYSSTKTDVVAGVPFLCNASNKFIGNTSISCNDIAITLTNASTYLSPLDPAATAAAVSAVTATVCANLGDAISAAADPAKWAIAGWVHKLDLASGVYLKERAISDPTSTRLNFTMFATTEPSSDMCAFAGNARTWALNCATGSAVSDTSCAPFKVTAVQGQLLMQLSTAAIAQIDVATFFEPGAAATSGTETGITPESAPPFALSPKKTKLLHWLER